jgi:hypothetical protein
MDAAHEEEKRTNLSRRKNAPYILLSFQEKIIT